MRLNLAAQDMAVLEARTEGWIAGLQLAALAFKARARAGTALSDFVAAFSGSHRYILDYLAEEVLQRQPQDVQSFLLQTSFLDRLSGPLCDAVTGQANSQATLAQLEHANLFLVTLDDEGLSALITRRSITSDTGIAIIACSPICCTLA